MNIGKNEKGSITLFILIVSIFILIVLLIVNIGIMNKNRSEEKKIEEIAKQYNLSETELDNTYGELTDGNEYVTAEQVQQMIDNNLLKQYPVGSIYITTNGQNPGEYLGGEWESYGEGRTIVGAGTGTDSNNVQKVFEINETGGEYEHTLTVNELARHRHNFLNNGNEYVGFGYAAASGGSGRLNFFSGSDEVSSSNPRNTTIQYNGGNQPHNNIQPYVVTYIWKRIS